MNKQTLKNEIKYTLSKTILKNLFKHSFLTEDEYKNIMLNLIDESNSLFAELERGEFVEKNI